MCVNQTQFVTNADKVGGVTLWLTTAAPNRWLLNRGVQIPVTARATGDILKMDRPVQSARRGHGATVMDNIAARVV
jgi:hypothetical protein